MSRSLDHLAPRFGDAVGSLITHLGPGYAVIKTTRTPWEQARLWRKSRRTRDIERAANYLDEHGATAMADVLIDVGPQYGRLGRHVTNALPGESWHQYGEAVDFVVVLDGIMTWRMQDPDVAFRYHRIGKAAEDAGMVWGGHWHDYGHVQGRIEGRPPLSWREIDERMRWLWGTDERDEPRDVWSSCAPWTVGAT